MFGSGSTLKLDSGSPKTAQPFITGSQSALLRQAQQTLANLQALQQTRPLTADEQEQLQFAKFQV